MTKVVLRMLSISITVLLGVLVVCGLYRIGIQCYDFGYRVYTEPAVSESDHTDVLVQITEDMDAKDLADVLEEKHLVRDSRLFFLQEKLSGYKLVPGVYTLNPSMTPSELMQGMTPEEQPEGEEAQS